MEELEKELAEKEKLRLKEKALKAADVRHLQVPYLKH